MIRCILAQHSPSSQSNVYLHNTDSLPRSSLHRGASIVDFQERGRVASKRRSRGRNLFLCSDGAHERNDGNMEACDGAGCRPWT